MKVMVVDPKSEDLIVLSESIRKISPPGTSVECFRDPLFAHQYACLNPVDVLYTVAEMSRMNGFELARFMRSKYPEIYIFFLSSSNDLRNDAKRFGADGYIVKPATSEALQKAKEEAEGSNISIGDEEKAL